MPRQGVAQVKIPMAAASELGQLSHIGVASFLLGRLPSASDTSTG
jgi:hypothetical protein